MEYGELKLEPGVYVPKSKREYSKTDPYEHVVEVAGAVEEGNKLSFDKDYPYLDDSPKAKWNRFLGYLFLWGPVVLVNRLHYGVKVHGRGVLDKYKDSLKNGAMAICNHVMQFDAVCVNEAVRPLRKLWIPMYNAHFNGNKRWMLVNLGGIPLPDDMEGMKAFNAAFDEYHRRKQWMLVFPEAVRWNDYKPLRPFRKGAFSMAYRYDFPLVPCVITFRPRKGLYRLFGPKDMPCYDITVCEPILPDRNAPRRLEVDRMRILAHQEMEKAAGILQNPWPPIPSEDTA